jgi:hypothetical protein
MIQFIQPLLKDRKNTIYQVLEKENKTSEIIQLFLFSLIFYAVFGFIIGCSQSLLQGLSSSIKLPVLFYATSFICLPTLYFFSSFLGVKQNFKQLIHFVILCNTYISLVLLAFAPVSFFFLIAAYHYALFKLINILIFSAAGLTGIMLFYKEFNKMMLDSEDDLKSKRSSIFIKAWSLMFAFIGLQLSFTISPFFGLPDAPFILFTPEKSNFFMNFAQTLGELF